MAQVLNARPCDEVLHWKDVGSNPEIFALKFFSLFFFSLRFSILLVTRKTYLPI